MRSLAGLRSGVPLGSWTVTTLRGAASATAIRYCSGRSPSSLRNTDSAREPALVLALAHVGFRIGVADVVEAARPVAVDDGEAAAVERESDTAPGAVEGLIDDQPRRAVGRLLDAGAIRLRGRLRDRRRGLRFGGAELHHQPRQHLGFEARVGRHQRPGERGRRRVVDLGRGHLLHPPVGDVDLHRPGLGAALDPGAELVALVGRVQDVGETPERAPERVGRQVGAVLRPVGLHDTQRRLLDREHEPGVAPELAGHVPRLLGRGLDDQPALVAGAHDPRVRDRREQIRVAGACRALLRGDTARGRDRVTVVVARRREVRRELQRRSGRRRLVVDALGELQRVAAGERERRRDDEGRETRKAGCGHAVGSGRRVAAARAAGATGNRPRAARRGPVRDRTRTAAPAAGAGRSRCAPFRRAPTWRDPDWPR